MDFNFKSNTYYLNDLILNSKISKTSKFYQTFLALILWSLSCVFVDLDESFTNCSNRIKSSNINKPKDKYLKSIQFIHANLTVYTLPVNLNELENIDTLTYLMNYSKIPKISRKQIQLIFNRHSYDYFLNTKRTTPKSYCYYNKSNWNFIRNHLCCWS